MQKVTSGKVGSLQASELTVDLENYEQSLYKIYNIPEKQRVSGDQVLPSVSHECHCARGNSSCIHVCCHLHHMIDFAMV